MIIPSNPLSFLHSTHISSPLALAPNYLGPSHKRFPVLRDVAADDVDGHEIRGIWQVGGRRSFAGPDRGLGDLQSKTER